MAKPDHSLDPLTLASARREFLEKGFEKASLKRICENANVTPVRSTNVTAAKRSCSPPWADQGECLGR